MPATNEVFLRSYDVRSMVSEEVRQWLLGLLKIETFTEKVHESIIGHLSGILNLKKSMGLYAGSWYWLEEFKPFFLFSNPEHLNCFDEAKLEAARLAVIPVLFQKACHHANAEVFRAHVEPVIQVIKEYAEENKRFQEVYEKKLNEIRAASTIGERSCDYLGNRYYTPQLIAELEDIDIALIDKKHLLYLLYGKKNYETIVAILCGKYNKNIIPRIADLPENNHSYQIFISIAAKRNNTAMLDRLFEGLSSDKILEIFFRYFDDKISKNEWLLDNARAEFPELLCIYLRNDIETLSSARQDFKLFTKYLAKFFNTAPEDERLIFLQALFPLTDESPNWKGHWVIQYFAGAERDLWENFANVLINEAVQFPDDYYNQYGDYVGSHGYPKDLYQRLLCGLRTGAKK